MIDAIAAPRTRSVRLRDGRYLAFGEWGDPGGSPVIHCHGMPGSRLEHQAAATVYARLGVRVITPDRPGYGLSDPLPGRRLMDWTSDVAELADQLAIERFAITALSGGGAFALACAAAMPDRVTRVVTAGCPAPLHLRAFSQGLPIRLRLGLRLAARASWLLAGIGGAIALAVRRNPEFFVDHANRDNPADLRWLAIPSVRAEAAAMIQEAFRRGSQGYIDDVRAVALGWGFEAGQISMPVHLWHGGIDTVIPPSHAWYLASAIPNATLHLCPGEGHMLMWNHLRQMLVIATGARGPRRSGAYDRPEAVITPARAGAA
jgi:pimeloyl-ACP methyl ester carboxylesterase